MKFGSVTICNVTKTKNKNKNYQNCSYRDDNVTNYVNFWKSYEKNG